MSGARSGASPSGYGSDAFIEIAGRLRQADVPEDEVGRMTERICSVAQPTISRDQWAQYFVYEVYDPPCPEVS